MREQALMRLHDGAAEEGGEDQPLVVAKPLKSKRTAGTG
jgi:hypothetical protein